MVVHETVTEELDLGHHNVPLLALGASSREVLCALLDPEKVILSPDGYPRDWRGLAALARIPGEYTSFISGSFKSGRTNKVLELWQKNAAKVPGVPPTVAQLQTFLQQLDRWDVYDDTLALFEKDVESYKCRYVKDVRCDMDEGDEVITDDDVALAPDVQRYHAYVLYDRADQEFAALLMDTLRKRRFAICCEDNLILGALTKVGPITKLISERCERLIVIFSPDFLKSPANKFYMDYAQSLAIEKQTRKIIPCMYRECQLQSSYRYLHMIYYSHATNGNGPLFNFWDKLEKSLGHSSQLHRVQVTDTPTAGGTSRPLPHPAGPAPSSSSAEPTRPARPTHELSLPTPPHHDLTHTHAQHTRKKPTFFNKIFTNRRKNKKSKEVAVNN